MGNVTGMRLLASKDGGYEIVPIKRPDKQVASPVGCSKRTIFKRKFNDKHSAVYVREKEIDMYARIQSFANQCDIVALAARAKTDPSVLQQRNGFYGDFSASGDLQDMLGAYNGMKGAFDSLAEEEKSKLGGSFESFLSGIANGSFVSSDGSQGVIKSEESKSEVITDES